MRRATSAASPQRSHTVADKVAERVCRDVTTKMKAHTTGGWKMSAAQRLRVKERVEREVLPQQQGARPGGSRPSTPSFGETQLKSLVRSIYEELLSEAQTPSEKLPLVTHADVQRRPPTTRNAERVARAVENNPRAELSPGFLSSSPAPVDKVGEWLDRNTPTPIVPNAAIFGTGRSQTPAVGSSKLVDKMRSMMTTPVSPSRRARSLQSQQDDISRVAQDQEHAREEKLQRWAVKRDTIAQQKKLLDQQIRQRNEEKELERQRKVEEGEQVLRDAEDYKAHKQREQQERKAKRMDEDAFCQAQLRAAEARKKDEAQKRKDESLEEFKRIVENDKLDATREAAAKKEAARLWKLQLNENAEHARAKRRAQAEFLAQDLLYHELALERFDDEDRKRQSAKQAVTDKVDRLEAIAAAEMKKQAEAATALAQAKEAWLEKKYQRETESIATNEAKRQADAASKASAQKTALNSALKIQMQHKYLASQRSKLDEQVWSNKAQQSMLSQMLKDSLAQRQAQQRQSEWVEVLDAQKELKKFHETQQMPTSIARSVSSLY